MKSQNNNIYNIHKMNNCSNNNSANTDFSKDSYNSNYINVSGKNVKCKTKCVSKRTPLMLSFNI